jgi:3-methylcrotonyl-CoA carboxylase alpha subunit
MNLVTDFHSLVLFQYVIRAPKDGVVKQVLFNAGDTASKGAPLVQFEAEE